MSMKRNAAQAAATDTTGDDPVVQPIEAQIRSADLDTPSPDADAGDATDAGAVGSAGHAGDAGDRAFAREEAIRQAAYESYLRRGGGSGNDVDDWLEAERQVDQGPPDVPGGQR